MNNKYRIQYKIQREAYEDLKQGKAINVRVGCSGKCGVDCGGSAVYINLEEIEDEIRALDHFVGAEANSFYVMIDDNEDTHDWLYGEVNQVRKS